MDSSNLFLTPKDSEPSSPLQSPLPCLLSPRPALKTPCLVKVRRHPHRRWRPDAGTTPRPLSSCVAPAAPPISSLPRASQQRPRGQRSGRRGDGAGLSPRVERGSRDEHAAAAAAVGVAGGASVAGVDTVASSNALFYHAQSQSQAQGGGGGRNGKKGRSTQVFL